MFDFRYHVVSLAAVFLALVFGILIGVGISGRGLVDEAERARLNADIADLQRQVEAADRASRDQQAAAEYVRESYDAVMHDRLAGKGVVVVFVGPASPAVRSSVFDAVTDAGGQPIRLRVIDIPVDPARIAASLGSDEDLADLADEDRLGEVGRQLGVELVAGGDSPLWDSLSPLLVAERSGRDAVPADAVVVSRAAPSDDGGDEDEDGATDAFLEGFYRGLAAEVPAVAVETTRTTPSTVDPFRHTSFSTVDNVDRPVGRVALVVLLAGGPVGHYGVREGVDGILPPVEPLRPADPGD